MNKYSNLKNLTFAAGIIFAVTACDLETEPTTSLSADGIFSTTENAEKVLTGA